MERALFFANFHAFFWRIGKNGGFYREKSEKWEASFSDITLNFAVAPLLSTMATTTTTRCDATTKKRVPLLADFRVRVVDVRVCVSTPTPIVFVYSLFLERQVAPLLSTMATTTTTRCDATTKKRAPLLADFRASVFFVFACAYPPPLQYGVAAIRTPP